MAAHTATISSEGDETVIRIAGQVRLGQGPVLVRESVDTGELILASAPERDPENSWAAFFDRVDAIPRDAHWDAFVEVMRERPMNRLPVERNLFGEE